METSFKSCDHILEGEVRMNAQNHFYMETMSTRAIPGENGEMEIFTSTQNPTDIQAMCFYDSYYLYDSC